MAKRREEKLLEKVDKIEKEYEVLFIKHKETTKKLDDAREYIYELKGTVETKNDAL
jgi:hypothetical protein